MAIIAMVKIAITASRQLTPVAACVGSVVVMWPPRFSGLAEHKVKRPAATDVRACPAQVAEDCGVSAARLLDGISQDRQILKVVFLVDSVRQGGHVRRPPGRGEKGSLEGIPEDVA